MSVSRNGNVEVYFRIFPMDKTECDLMRTESSTIYIKSSQETLKDNKQFLKYWQFESSGVFRNDSQEFIYSCITKGLLERIVKGYSGIIIGYGQTGTGKSYTLGGLHLSEEEFGIIPRVIFDLFNTKNELPKNFKMNIHMSYTEFSKSSVIDLLKGYPNYIDPWHVKNASKINVKSEFEALKLLYKGEGRKTFGNNNTYMSHINSSVLTLHITRVNQDFTRPEKISSRLHIIDLAGIDSVGNVSSNFKSPLDIGNANTIKSYMEQFILFLKQNIPRNIQVKERTNPLIYFLGSDLSNENILRFIGHIRVQKEDIKITMSTLRFGQLVRGLKPKIKEIEPEMNEDVKLQHFQNKLEHLQKEKIYYSVLMNQDLTTDLNQHRMEHIQRTVEAYLQSRISELNVLNVAEASEVFKMFKNICNAFDEEKNKPHVDSDLAKHRRGSKSNSKTSLKNIRSVKRTKRSKDSFTLLEKSKLTKTPSTSSLQGKPTAGSRLNSVKSSTSQSRMKKIKSNSTVGKQSSVVIARKSTGSSSIKDRRESKGYVVDTTPIPDIIPKYAKAWETFISDVKSSYKAFCVSHKANETELKKIYQNYLKEVKKLRYYKDVLERRQNELTEAKMFQQFIDSCKTNVILTDSERVCEENLENAHAEFLDQQEVVLRIKSELKIYLDNRREIKQHLKDDFDQYCKENYNIFIPCVGEEEEEEFIVKEEALNIEDKSGDEDGEEHQQKCIGKSETTRLEKLKKIMKKELQKNAKLRDIKNRKWKNLH